MKVIGQGLLDDLSQAARENPRRRKNHNIHDGDAAPCHRLFNAIEPGSYIRPHRHLDPAKDETFVMVRGSLGVVTFDDAGNVLERVRISAGGEAVAADIPHGVFHTAVSLAEGSVFFEAKSGPYLPLAPEEHPPWAPEPDSPEASAYLASLLELFR